MVSPIYANSRPVAGPIALPEAGRGVSAFTALPGVVTGAKQRASSRFGARGPLRLAHLTALRAAFVGESSFSQRVRYPSRPFGAL
jgi:hypothetical protein